MARLSYIKGQGSFETEDGKTVKYPINKLIITNNQNEELDVKLDKVSNRILPFMFNMEDSGTKYITEVGEECDLYYLKEKIALEEE